MTTSPTTMLTQPDEARRFLLPLVRRAYPGTTKLNRLTVEPLGSVQAGRGVFRYTAMLGGAHRRRIELFANHDVHGGGRSIYHFLRHLDRHGFHRGLLRAPQPLGYSYPQKTLVYESFPGVRVRDLVERRTLSAKTLAHYLEQSADWLRRFHELPTTVGVRHSTVLSLQAFSRLSSAHRHLLRSALPSMNRAVRQAGGRAALVHGDPHLANCIRGAGRSFAFIDYSESYIGNPLADVGMFLVHLDVALKPFYRRTVVANLQTHFLDRYFRKQLDAQTRRTIVAYQLRSAAHFLGFTADHHHRPTGYVGWILRRLEYLVAQGEHELASEHPQILLAA